jgi:hypothetical protein
VPSGIVQPQHRLRRLADRDRDGVPRHRGRDRELDALAAGQRRRQQRSLLVDLLVAQRRDGSRQRQAAFLRHRRRRHRVPAVDRLDQDLARPVDADLEHAGGVELLAQRPQELDDRGRVATPGVRGPLDVAHRVASEARAAGEAGSLGCSS